MTVILSLAPWGKAGVEFLNIPIGPRVPEPPIKWNVMDPFPSMPSDGVLEVEFASDRPADYIRSATAWTGNHIPLMTLDVIQRTPRNFRLRTPQPLPPGSTFGIDIETHAGEKATTLVRTWKYATPESRQVIVGPTLEMGEVPLNAVIWLQSKTVLNPLTVRPVVTADGETVPFTAEVLDTGFLVILRPPGLLRGNAVYQVSLTGVQDQAGRPIPDRTWWFRTGAGPDFTPTLVESWSPSGTAATDVVPRVTFTHPVIFRRAAPGSYDVPSASDFTIMNPSWTVSGAIDFSSDGRTLSFTPDGRWPRNSNIELPVTRFNYMNWTTVPVGNPLAATPVFSTGDAP